MDIKELGGEFSLIKHISRWQTTKPSLIKGIGDDCAVLEHSKEKYLLVSTDMMVENSHFTLKFHKPYQIGKKLMEVNVSDIISMGGYPTFAFISLSLTPHTQVEFVDEIYHGIHDSALNHNTSIAGGDITHGTELVLNLTILGEVAKDLLTLRSGAEPGNLVCVTGTLGGSQAGLNLLMSDMEGYVMKHLEPTCRAAREGEAISRFASSMIDISDGLGSEIQHICQESKTGARIEVDKIPIAPSTIDAARKLGHDPYDYALYGGEDFELLFTIPEKHIFKLKNDFTDFTIVGQILEKSEGITLLKSGKKEELKKGYDHFQ